MIVLVDSKNTETMYLKFSFTDDEETSQSDEDTLSVVSLGSTIYQPDSTEEDVALVLPSGGVIGHRSLLRFVHDKLKYFYLKIFMSCLPKSNFFMF